MGKALLDTDIFSELLKGIDQEVIARAIAYRAAFGRYTLSVITVMEIVKGHRLMMVRLGKRPFMYTRQRYPLCLFLLNSKE